MCEKTTSGGNNDDEKRNLARDCLVAFLPEFYVSWATPRLMVGGGRANKIQYSNGVDSTRVGLLIATAIGEHSRCPGLLMALASNRVVGAELPSTSIAFDSGTEIYG